MTPDILPPHTLENDYQTVTGFIKFKIGRDIVPADKLVYERVEDPSFLRSDETGVSVFSTERPDHVSYFAISPGLVRITNPNNYGVIDYLRQFHEI